MRNFFDKLFFFKLWTYLKYYFLKYFRYLVTEGFVKSSLKIIFILKRKRESIVGDNTCSIQNMCSR